MAYCSEQFQKHGRSASHAESLSVTSCTAYIQGGRNRNVKAMCNEKARLSIFGESTSHSSSEYVCNGGKREETGSRVDSYVVYAPPLGTFYPIDRITCDDLGRGAQFVQILYNKAGWPNGKALDYESRDCRFDPCVGQNFLFSSFLCGILFFVSMTS